MAFEKEKIELREYKELPYTTIMHTSLPSSFHMCFKAKGLKKLIENCHDEDLVHVTVKNGERTKFEISKFKLREQEKHGKENKSL